MLSQLQPSVNKANFNELFDAARAIDRTLRPHPITRVPPDVLREIFDTVAQIDPDAPLMLLNTCTAWKALVLETPSLWNNIHIAVDHEDVLEALGIFLYFSRSVPLDVSLVGMQTPNMVLGNLISHAYRIRSLDIRLQKEASEPFRLLSASPDGLCSLSLLVLETPTQVINRSGPSMTPVDTLAVTTKNGGALDVHDFALIQALPLLSYLSSLVLHNIGATDVPLLVLPSMKSLRLLMKDSPTLLGSFKCNQLEMLDVVLDDTSREGWWDLLLKSLVYPNLLSLTLDVTLDRKRDDWSNPWNSDSFKRLPTHLHVSTLAVTLAFSDQEYVIKGDKAEYLCADLLEEFLSCFPSLTDLGLLHVPFLHTPWIWPSTQILQGLQRLELQVPGLVDGIVQFEIVLPALRELRYHGVLFTEGTRLPALQAPSLQYLEIMHHVQAIHPVYVQVDRRWPGTTRNYIYKLSDSTSKEDGSRDYPTWRTLPTEYKVSLPVVQQSIALRELRIFLHSLLSASDIMLEEIEFPFLKTIYCSASHLKMIDAPQLEELHLLWGNHVEHKEFEVFPRHKRSHLLRQLCTVDFYSHFDPRYHNMNTKAYDRLKGLSEWMKLLDSLQIIILPLKQGHIDEFIPILRQDPRLCPKLTMIDSYAYPSNWVEFHDLLEVRNHLAMRDHTIEAIHTLRFPLALHSNIAGPLKDALSGRFSSNFVPIISQPWALFELLSADERHALRWLPETCIGCRKSGSISECTGTGTNTRLHFPWLYCSRHLNRLPGRGSTITAYSMGISGYLEEDTD